jgi:hypothetical protein
MRTIPDYADVMPLQEFVEAVEHGLFTNDDGSGYYANPPLMQDHTDYLDCQDIADGLIRAGFTHVAWFNK